ncbi:MAG: 50S ribosomal protein L1 [Candidatus Omnitrophica bacterium]|nr:50S ribosomal protein L1 [Candidatus Omnitrophota bacterium]
MKTTKRKKHNEGLVENGKVYTLEEAVSLIKKTASNKFDASVDMQMKLNADPTASDQVVRGTTALPHGTGKSVRVVVLTRDESGNAAKEAGADEVGSDELIQRIMGGWIDFDVVVATPSMMKDIAKLGRVLGPRGLMPSPKSGTVTDDLAGAVKQIKKGRIEFKMDKQSNLNASIGRISFDEKALAENGRALMLSLMTAKPKSVKGDFVQRAHLSSTMGPGIRLDAGQLVREVTVNES